MPIALQSMGEPSGSEARGLLRGFTEEDARSMMLGFVIFIAFAAPAERETLPVVAYADVTLEVSPKQQRITEVKPGRFDKPTALPRYRGRFEARALRGKEVLERVRFDVPMLHDAETDDASDEARKFAEQLRAHASVRTRVRVPLPEGTDAIAIVDGKTGRTTTVPLGKAPEAPRRGVAP
jgi:hypothetical protein